MQGIASEIHHRPAAGLDLMTNLAPIILDLDIEGRLYLAHLSNLVRSEPGKTGFEGWMIAVVKSLDQTFATRFGRHKHGFCFLDIHRKRLFAEDVFPRLQSLDRPFGMQIDRQRIIDEVNLLSRDHFLIGLKHLFDIVLFGIIVGARAIARGNGHQTALRRHLRGMNQRFFRDPCGTQHTNSHIRHRVLLKTAAARGAIALSPALRFLGRVKKIPTWRQPNARHELPDHLYF